METIPFQTIQNSIDNICGLTTEEDLDAVSQAFFDAQPGLAGFVVEFIEDMSEGAKDLGFMMALILWKSFDEKYPQMRSVSDDDVVAKFEEQEGNLEKLLKLNDDMLEEIHQQETLNGQPEILNYITQELFAEEATDPELGEDEELHLFMVMRFLTSVLNEAARSGLEVVKH